MRLACAAAMLALGAATPALATGGYECRPERGNGPTLALVIGHGAGPAMVGARLAAGRTVRSTYDAEAPLLIGQSWIDRQYLWLDLTDAGAMRYEARLRTRFTGQRGRPAVGTLSVAGRTYAVRCVEA